MSFNWFRPEGPLRTREQIAREVHAVSLSRRLDELATVIALMTISTEVGTGTGDDRQWWCPANPTHWPDSQRFPHDSYSDDNRSSGYFQQQPGPRGEPWWGSTESMMTLSQAANTFLERLSDDYVTAAGSAWSAGRYAQQVQQSAYPDRYAEKWGEAWDVLGRALQGGDAPTPTGWTGDPIWLPDVLRNEGLTCHIYPGAFERGHGDMGQIWGVMCHHTGSFGETPRGIAQHPSLGLASQLYLSREGEYTLCGVGIAYHGGRGSYPGISDVNGTLIGIEAANDGGGTPNRPLIHRSSWSDAQYNAYVRGVAAILRKIGRGAERCISHKEWAGAAQGKWDPGQIDMNIFRADVAAHLGGGGIWDRIHNELMGIA